MQKSKLLIISLFTFIVIFYLSLPCFGSETTYVWSNNSTPTVANSNSNINLESPSAILIEQSTRANFI